MRLMLLIPAGRAVQRKAQPGPVELASSSQEGKSIFQFSGQREKMTDLELQNKDEAGIS